MLHALPKRRSALLLAAAPIALLLLLGGTAGAQAVLRAIPAAAILASGERLTVSLRGTDGTLSAGALAPIVGIAIDQTAHAVTLTGLTLGTTTVRVTDTAGDLADIPVTVQTSAGQVPGHVGLTVTGDPATPGYLAARITAAAAAAVGSTTSSGSRVQALAILPGPQVLDSGFLTSFRVPVRIEPGPGALAVTGFTTVDVQNAALPRFVPAVLAFADDPERIVGNGVLSRTLIEAAQPTRLYYYHENKGEPRRFCVVLSANGSVRSHVQFIDAAAGPNIDVMTVGHVATRTFLDRQSRAEGLLVAIDGGKPLVERDTVVAAGDGIVGVIDLRVVDGGPVTVTVLALPPGAAPAMYLYGSPLPRDGHNRHGSFALGGFGERIIGFTAGGPAATYSYGTRAATVPAIDPADLGRDYGDYGVVEHVTFDVDNPTDAPATVFLYEKPLGGVVRSSFSVNGNIVEMGCVRVPNRYLVATNTVGARATAAIDVRTMTDGGSNYPLEIGLTSTPPVATVPLIAAADGCFPKPATRKF